jgi:hypothetical protein
VTDEGINARLDRLARQEKRRHPRDFGVVVEPSLCPSRPLSSSTRGTRSA